MRVEQTAIAVLSSSVLVAVVGLFSTVITFKLNRSAKLQDDQIQETERLDKLESQVQALEARVNSTLRDFDKLAEALKRGQMIMLSDRILTLAESYIANGEITYAQKKNLRAMHQVYHNELGGNGDFDDLMKDIEKLKVNYTSD